MQNYDASLECLWCGCILGYTSSVYADHESILLIMAQYCVLHIYNFGLLVTLDKAVPQFTHFS